MVPDRGGKNPPISLDSALGEARYLQEPRDDHTPEQQFERNWASALLAGVNDRLRDELAALERRGLELDDRERAIEAERAAGERRLREREGRQHADAAKRLDRELARFRKQARRALDSIEDAAARKKAEEVAKLEV